MTTPTHLVQHDHICMCTHTHTGADTHLVQHNPKCMPAHAHLVWHVAVQDYELIHRLLRCHAFGVGVGILCLALTLPGLLGLLRLLFCRV